MNVPSPNQFRELIPSVNGDFCEKFRNSLQVPGLFYQFYAEMYKENGDFTDEFKAAICALGCVGGGGGDGDPTIGTPAIAASDGAYSNKVQITWGAITDATGYIVYRGTVNNASLSTQVGTTAAGVLLFDDVSVTPGTTYFYWVRAQKGVAFSAYSNPDTGYASTVVGVLTAVSDLEASPGISIYLNRPIILRFTPPAGATKYDFYRNTVDDFATATLIDSDKVPFDSTESLSGAASNRFHIEYGGTNCRYENTPPTNFDRYFYWVIAKKDGPVAVSGPSNSAAGWVVGRGDGTVPLSNLVVESDFNWNTITIPGGATRCRFVLIGGCAGGAGGSSNFGGGGGGGAALMIGEFDVTGGNYIFLTSDPATDVAASAARTGGGSGSPAELHYGAGRFTATVIASIAEGTPGSFNSAGGGTGGTGGTPGAFDGSVENQLGYAGYDGKPGVLYRGGVGGGHRFGYQNPGAHFNTFAAGSSYSGTASAQSGSGGGGSYGTRTFAEAVATGGGAWRATAYLVFYA